MIHQFSCVHPNAKLHPTVEVGPFSVIEDNVEIGEGTVIDSNVTIKSGTRIGKNCRIFPSAVIGAVPQDLKFKGEDTLAIIGDNTTLRECVTVHRGTASKGKTVVGSNCLIMAYTHLAHDCIIHDNVIMSNAIQAAGEVEIDEFAVIGGGALIHQFTHVGRNAMLQGGVRVNKDIPPYAMAAHEPVAFAGINIVGLRRHGFTHEQIETIQEAYRIIYNSGLNFSDAVKTLLVTLPASYERNIIADFVKNSSRGIVRGNL